MVVLTDHMENTSIHCNSLQHTATHTQDMAVLTDYMEERKREKAEKAELWFLCALFLWVVFRKRAL